MRLLSATLFLVLSTSCVQNSTPRRVRTAHGTCESACDYYQSCKKSHDRSLFGTCVSECRTIFSEDGEIDGDGLLRLQRLDCPELLAFIDGAPSGNKR